MTIRLAVLASLMVLASCAGSSTSVNPADTPTPSPAVATPGAEPTVAEAEPTATEAEPTVATVDPTVTQVQPTATAAEQPAPEDTTEAASSVEIQVGAARWSVTLIGVQDGGPGLNEPESRCLNAYGVVTLIEFPGGLPSQRVDLPWLSAETGQESIGAGFASCDRDLVAERGWLWFKDVELVEGGAQPFHAHFLIPAGQQVGRLGVRDQADVSAFVPWPTVTQEVPVAPSRVDGDSSLPEPLPQSDLPLAPDAAQWSLQSLDLLPRAQADEGQCYLLFGFVQAQTIESGFLTETGPEFALLTDRGRVDQARPTQCPFEDALGNGYLFAYNAEVREGTRYPFFAPFVVPSGETIVAALVDLQGAATTELVTPRPADQLGDPLLDLQAQRLQDQLPPLAGSEIVMNDGIDTWRVEVTGSVITEGVGRGNLAGRCLVVFGRMTPVESPEPDSLTLFRPRLSVVADGIKHWYESGSCDTTEATSLGYLTRPDHMVGETSLFVDFAFVPHPLQIEAVTLGRSAPWYSVDPGDGVSPP